MTPSINKVACRICNGVLTMNEISLFYSWKIIFNRGFYLKITLEFKTFLWIENNNDFFLLDRSIKAYGYGYRFTWNGIYTSFNLRNFGTKFKVIYSECRLLDKFVQLNLNEDGLEKFPAHTEVPTKDETSVRSYFLYLKFPAALYLLCLPNS